jgi:Ser/Thr protein kinase RdoA (MazF antagonist)
MPLTVDNELISQAMQAASELAHRVGAGQVEPVFLHHSEHISVLWPSAQTVARIIVCTEDGAAERLSRELAVARHLSDSQAPIVPASALFPAGPHFQGKFGLTLWQFVEHTAMEQDNPAHMANAAVALRQIHLALADYPGVLPSFRTKFENCRALLEDRLALPALAAADRKFLLVTYDRIVQTVDALPAELVPIHGDAGPHNIFVTSDGVRYADFEDVCLGPREWDVGWLPDVDLAAFEPVHRGRLSALSDLRSLCVSVWCFAKYDMPDKREAADYHLACLRRRLG